MVILAAYNYCGDLVADGCDEDELLDAVEAAGYHEDDVVIVQVTP